MEFESELTKWLLLCSRVLKAKEPVDAEIVEIWKGVLMSERVTVQELAFGFEKLLKSDTFFPTPSEFLKTLDRVRPSFAVIEDPVLTGENEIGSRRLAESKGLPYHELRESRPELPGCKHPPTIEKVKSMPELPSPRDIEAKRELMRRQAGR